MYGVADGGWVGEGGRQSKHSYKYLQAERDGRTQAAHFRAAPFPLLAWPQVGSDVKRARGTGVASTGYCSFASQQS